MLARIAATGAALLLFLPAPAAGWTGDSRKLADAAGTLVNRALNPVHCDDGLPNAGMAEVPGRDVWILGTYCNPWEGPEQERYRYDSLLGPAIITLAHEALHSRGYLNEAKVECWALQKTDDLARILGFSEQRIPSIWHYAYRDHRNLISTAHWYGDRRCRPNGAWDLTPADGRWP